MPFTRKGEKRTHQAGRKPGTQNRISADLRNAILTALCDAGGGGENGSETHLKACATDEDPRVRSAFLALVGRCLPREVKLEHEGPLVTIRDYTRNPGDARAHPAA